MIVKITPQWDNRGPAEKLEFSKLIQHINNEYYATLLMHFTDGSVLMRKMSNEEIVAIERSRDEDLGHLH